MRKCLSFFQVCFQGLVTAGIFLGIAPAIQVEADDQLTTRCSPEVQLSIAEAEGRNAWARKCEYLKKEVETFANQNLQYVVFKDEVSQGRIIAPTLESASCIPGLVKILYCSAKSANSAK